MAFEAGQFQKFRVTTRVHLGAIAKDLYEDDIIEYDGHTMKYGPESYAIPILRAGIQAGWLVPAVDKTSTYKPKSAGIKLRPIDSSKAPAETNTESDSVSEDEAVVGTLDRSNESRRVKDMPTRTARAAGKKSDESGAKVKVASEDIYEPEFSEPERTVEEADEINHKRIREIKAALEKKAAKKFAGDISADVTVGSSGAPSASESEGVVVKTYAFSDKSSGVAVGATDSVAGRAKAIDITRVTASSIEAKQKPIGKRASTQIPAEGNTDIRQIHKTGATGDAAITTVSSELAELLPEAAVVGAAKKSRTKSFQWDMDRHWKTRVKDALDNYASNPMLLRQIVDMEVPSVKERIQKAIGEAE